MIGAMFRRPAASLLVAVVTGVAPGVASTPLLKRLVLTPAQVGSGYRLQMIPQGDVVKHQVSLDLCDFTYASERLRTGRLQVAYLHAGRVTQLSNEVVTYSRGGARIALAELFQALKTCPARPVTGPTRGSVPTTHHLTRLIVPRLSLPYLAVDDRASATIRGKMVRATTLEIYMTSGDVLSAIYTDGTGSLKAQKSLAFHAAIESAKNLTRARR